MHFHIKTLLLLLLPLLCSTVAATSSSTSTPGASVFPDTYCKTAAITTWEQAERWTQFVNEFYIVKNLTVAYGSFVSADYIQHNPSVGQGAAAAISYLSPFWQTTTITILHLGFDDSIGWIHFRVDGLTPQPLAITDIYRFDPSCIQEHWDVIQMRRRMQPILWRCFDWWSGYSAAV
ncbi:hypothetical protein B0A48_18394 [Cryoendolithus antarcticus]|uniref:SnoaL-like domain-containing protein n=1 Tax=Cryoendolithus antarcticus TaxID=1507870 RepID=A0A1V8S9F4_9PEZI|nr:hypothetical protein B0A48_18394 [Cryoendolithus antarcticus]